MIIKVPDQIANALLSIAVKTEAGSALVAGFIIGKDKNPSGKISIIAESVIMEVEESGSTETPRLQGSPN